MNSKHAKSKDDDQKLIKGTSKQTSPLPMKELIKYGYRLLEYVSDDYLYITFGLLAVLTNSVTNLAFPWIIGQAVDKAAKGQNSAQFKTYLLTSSAILILGSVSSFLRVYCLGISNYRIVIRMKQSLYQNYLQQDLEFFDQSQCGELITILDKDIQSASLVYTDILTSTLRSINSAINGSILLYLNSPKLCGITLLSVPIVGIGAMVMAINSSKQSTALRNFSSNSLTHTIEKLNNMTTIKINGKEKFELETFQKMLQGCYVSAKKMFTAQGAFMSYLNLTTNGCLILVLYVGGSMLGTGEISSGKLTTFALQSGFVGLGYSGLSTAYSELREALMACQRFYETLDEKIIRENHTQLTTDSPQTLEQNLPSAPVPTPPTLSTPSLTSTSSLFSSSPIISLNGVNYSYPTRPDRLVLQNISMSFRMQAIQIIIGKSGSGKSTLLSLLCGLYHPTVGDISISGSATSGASLNLDWVREHIGVVEQSAKLFSGTIRENICYGSQSDVTQSQIEEVAKSVNAHDFILSLPDGYDTQVGEGGQMLSGGQRARVALARALIKDPEILILDEPSASLDTESEDMLIQLLLKFRGSKCIIIFTHSDAIMSIADQLYLIDQGAVVTSGTYDDLMKNCQSEREIAILRAVSSLDSLKQTSAQCT